MAAKALAKAQREGVREHAARVNGLKRCIDELKVSLEMKCQLRCFYFRRIAQRFAYYLFFLGLLSLVLTREMQTS